MDGTDELRPVVGMQPFPVGPSTFEAIWEARDAASAALITPKRTWSTAELRSEVERVACALLTRGLGAGDRVVWVRRSVAIAAAAG